MNFEGLDLGLVTEEYLLNQAEAMGEELGVDIRQGSIYMDAAKGHIIRTSKFFEDLRMMKSILDEDTCIGEVLDDKARLRGLERHAAQPSKWHLEYEGIPPAAGARVFAGSYFFTVNTDSVGYKITAEQPGTDTNRLYPGLPVVPVNDVPGLVSCCVGGLIEPGTLQEGDEEFRKRYKEKVSGPSENGNYAHYKSWCESIEGIGRARVIPLWAGANTVKAILVSTDGASPTEAVVAKVQRFIDPGSTGLGYGVANIGARFTAAAALPIYININADVVLQNGYTKDAATNLITEAVVSYLRVLAIESGDEEIIIVRYSRIGAILASCEALVDYTSILINGREGNVTIGDSEVAVLGEVQISVNL